MQSLWNLKGKKQTMNTVDGSEIRPNLVSGQEDDFIP